MKAKVLTGLGRKHPFVPFLALKEHVVKIMSLGARARRMENTCRHACGIRKETCKLAAASCRIYRQYFNVRSVALHMAAAHTGHMPMDCQDQIPYCNICIVYLSVYRPRPPTPQRPRAEEECGGAMSAGNCRHCGPSQGR